MRCARATVDRHGGAAEQLGEFACRAAPEQIHFEVAFLRMHVAERPSGIGASACADRRRAERVAFDRNGLRDAVRCHFAVVTGQARAQCEPARKNNTDER
jgi:hypothetical protein